MGFETKMICTVVPNPYHKAYNTAANDYYYFSVFVTPRLQFDGTLREFYEMLNWPDFRREVVNSMILSGKDPTGRIFKDIHIDPDTQLSDPKITDKAARLWKKLFTRGTPVTAWPINLKPVSIDWIRKNSEEFEKRFVKDQAERMVSPGTSFITALQRVSIEVKQPASPLFKKLQQEKKKQLKQLLDSMKLEDQEFHKKISALASYPQILRALGLIWDFIWKNLRTN